MFLIFLAGLAAGIVFLVFLAGLQEAGPEGRSSCSSNLKPQPQQYEAGGLSWQSVSSTEWARQASGRRSTSSSSSGPPRRTASSRGFATLTWQMGKLNVHTTNINESLGQHIESTQNWQRYTGERIRNLEQQ